MNELEQYKKAVKDYAVRHENYLFHNEGNDHALIIFSNIFNNANNTIRIAANKLCNKEVSNNDEYISSLRNFLNKKDSKLFILLTQTPTKQELNEENCLYQMLYTHPAYQEGRIEIKDGENKSFHDNNHHTIHLCMGDENMYRIENDTEKRKAVANFGDKDMTIVLNEAFDKAFDSVNKIVDLSFYYGQ